jgi:hypothetical protein
MSIKAKAINGMIDRLVRPLKEIIDRYRIAVNEQTSFSTILDKVIAKYAGPNIGEMYGAATRL